MFSALALAVALPYDVCVPDLVTFLRIPVLQVCLQLSCLSLLERVLYANSGSGFWRL